ncbi:hypothetical protein D1007_16405 [Hordeum vulgare]|nr:hypothetical protein D1007_16405 [Hordeum vulgare]
MGCAMAQVVGPWSVESRAVILSAWPRHRGVALGSRGNEDDRRHGRMEENGLGFVLDLVVRFPLREEFVDNLEHLDPVPLRLLPMGEAGALGPEDSNGESGSYLSSRTLMVVRCRKVFRISDKRNVAANPAAYQGLRLGSAPSDRTLCASRMTALEQSIRKFAEEPTKSVIKPELGTSFDSLDEAYDFYSLYSWEVGFGIRYGKSD